MSAPRKKSQKKLVEELKENLDEIPISKIEQNKIDQLFAQALLRYKNETLIEKKLKIQEISHLSAIAEEYLSCFALIGYSVQNEQVVVLSMPTQKDEAALIDLLRSTFLDITNNRP